MTWNKGKIIAGTLVASMALMMSGCNGMKGFNINVYDHSDKYVAGDTTYEALGIKNIEVDWVSGGIKISQSDEETLNIDENSDSQPDAVKVHSYVDGDTLKVKFCESGYTKKIDASYKKVEIQIPAGCNISINTVSAPISTGDLEAKDISINSVSGSTNLLNVVSDSFEVNATSGSTIISSLKTGAVNTNSVSGDVIISSLEATKIDSSTVSGNVQFDFVDFNDLEVSTVSGDARINIPEDFGVTVYKSSVSGKFKSPLDFEKKGDAFIFGDGASEIEFDSTSGDIILNEVK